MWEISRSKHYKRKLEKMTKKIEKKKQYQLEKAKLNELEIVEIEKEVKENEKNINSQIESTIQNEENEK